MSVLDLALNPIRGVTPLWKVAVLYSMVGGAIIAVAAMIIAPTTLSGARAVAFVGLLYGTYVVIAAYRCATNCPWPVLARLIRLCAVVSLMLVPFAAYELLFGEIVVAT